MEMPLESWLMADRPQVTVYTDGGCRPNPGTGAWAAILQSGDHEREFVGGEYDTTNNRMELLAAINALEALKKPCDVIMVTDSQYVKNGITTWLPGWRARNWQRKTGEVKNLDLWKRLDVATKRHQIEWRWTKGHANDELNERADQLCGAEIDRLDAAKKA